MSIEHLPPQSIETEESVLSSCLLAKDAFIEASEIITADDFYKTKHKKIFEAMDSLSRKNEPIDVETVFNESEGIAASDLVAIMDKAPVASNVREYSKIVKDKSILRQIIGRAQKAAQMAFENADPTYLLDYCQSQFLEINNPLKQSFCDQSNLMQITVDQIERCSRRQTESILPTGLERLDRLMGGGIQGSKLIIISARPGIGKTAIKMNIASSIARHFLNHKLPNKVGILQLEMEKEELGIRQLASATNINTLYLFSGRKNVMGHWVDFDSDDWDRINEAAARLATLPILTDDTPALPLQEVVRRIRMLVKKGARIVFIDQLSKIREPGKEYEAKTKIVNRLAELKKELRIPIVLLAQINRSGDLKSTGSLEEDADIIMRLRQTNDMISQDPEIFKASLTVEKHRGGPVGPMDLLWFPHITTFRTEAHSWE